MAIVINGSGSITGISAGGLPDGSVTADDLASGAVTSTKLADTLDLTGKTVTLPAGVGGKVLQVVSTKTQARQTTTSTSFIDATGYTVSITPSSTSSKILVTCNLFCGSPTTYAIWFKVLRDSTDIGNAVSYSGGAPNADYMTLNTALTILDAPATTSAITYKIQFRADGGTVCIGGPLANSYASGTALNDSSITVMEIAA